MCLASWEQWLKVRMRGGAGDISLLNSEMQAEQGELAAEQCRAIARRGQQRSFCRSQGGWGREGNEEGRGF